MRNNTFSKTRTIKNSENAAMAHYDAYGELYDSERNEEFYGFLAAGMLEKISGGSFGNILEIGCGTGILTGKLLAQFPKAKIHAIDISENMLRLAGQKFSRAGVSFFRELSELPSTDYDLIISNYSYHWWSEDFCKSLKAFVSGNCLFVMSAPAKCSDLSSGNIAIARAIRALGASSKDCVGKTAGITIDDVIKDFGFPDMRFFNEIHREEFTDAGQLLKTLKIRGSLLALSTAYGVNESDLEHQIRSNLKNTPTPTLTWPTIITINTH